MNREEALILYVLCSLYRMSPKVNRGNVFHIQQEAASVLGVPEPKRMEDIGDFIERFYKRVTG